MSEDRCIFCGEIIAEGSQFCQECYARLMKDLPDGWQTRDVPKCPRRESMIIGYRYLCVQCDQEVRFDQDRYCPNCGQRQNWEKWKERRNGNWKNT